MASETRLCRIEETLGRVAICPEERCPFWEAGGAAGGSCAFEKLDFSSNRELADWLLHVRETIDLEKDETRRLFHRLLNEGQGE